MELVDNQKNRANFVRDIIIKKEENGDECRGNKGLKGIRGVKDNFIHEHSNRKKF